MTSGVFGSVLLDSIIVVREERNRRNLTDIDALAASIQKRGLIHPPVVTRDRLLVAGECRLEACRRLGWTHISVQWADTLSRRQARAIELEENIKRNALPFEDEVRAVREWHDIAVGEDPTWTQEQTAGELGIKQSFVSQQIAVAKAIEKGEIDPKKVTFSVARGILQRKAERLKATSDELLRDITVDAPVARQESILNEDFLLWAPKYSGP